MNLFNPPRKRVCEGAYGPVQEGGVVGIKVLMADPRTKVAYVYFLTGDCLKGLLTDQSLYVDTSDESYAQNCFWLCKRLRGRMLSTITELQRDEDGKGSKWIMKSAKIIKELSKPFGYDNLDNCDVPAIASEIESCKMFDDTKELEPEPPAAVIDEEATKKLLLKQAHMARSLRELHERERQQRMGRFGENKGVA